MKTLTFTYNQQKQKEVDVFIGKNSTSHLSEVVQDLSPDKVFLVADKKIINMYGKNIRKLLSTNFTVHEIIHPSREKSKNLESILSMSNEFFDFGGTASSVIISLGGGVTGNMAGFLASIIFRGIKLIHVPTTLLAQLDSAVDVKQSVNSKDVKNSIGSFKAPDVVIIDPTYLESLDSREILSGLAEALKHGIAQDMTLLESISTEEQFSIDFLEDVISKTIQLKFMHWEKNPDLWSKTIKTEYLTHLGHTTGKILEMIDVDYLTHGEAISHGMVIEAYASLLLGYLDKKSVDKIYGLFSDLKLLYPLNSKYSKKEIIKKLYLNGKKPVFAILTELGNPETMSISIDPEVMEKSLDWYFSKS